MDGLSEILKYTPPLFVLVQGGCKGSTNEPSDSFLLHPLLACGQREAEVRHHYISAAAVMRRMSHSIPLPAPLLAETVHVLIGVHVVSMWLRHAHAQPELTTRPPEKLRKPEALVLPDNMCMRFP